LRDLGATVELTGFDAKSIEELIAGPRAPGSFDSYDETIETEHQCPKCGFSWSGSAGISHKVAEEQDSETL
jgi:hypothetical protein